MPRPLGEPSGFLLTVRDAGVGVDLFAIDDSKQNKPTGDGMGPLVAVGGVHVVGDAVRDLELALDALCKKTGFPDGEEFKWVARQEVLGVREPQVRPARRVQPQGLEDRQGGRRNRDRRHGGHHQTASRRDCAVA